jgi:thioredoxin-related protein
MELLKLIFGLIIVIWIVKKFMKTDWSKASDEKLFSEAEKISKKAKIKGLYEVSNHRDGCEYCKFVVRDSNSATNLKCSKKKIFVPVNLQCAEFAK